MSQIATALHEPLLQEEEQEQEQSETPKTFTWCDVILGWIILPLLLFVQFYLAFVDDQNKDLTHLLDYPTVNWSIVLYCITSWLFRHSCQDLGLTNTVFLVLPEIGMDIVLALVLFHQVVYAYLTLLLCMLLLALWVAGACLYILVVQRGYATTTTESKSLSDNEDLV